MMSLLLLIEEVDTIVLGCCYNVLCWMPCSLKHSFREICRATAWDGLQFLSSIIPQIATWFSTFVIERSFIGHVLSTLHINNMEVSIVRACEHVFRARGTLQFELVKNVFWVIEVTKFLLDVITNLDGSHGLWGIPYVPNLAGNIIPWVDVLPILAEHCIGYRVDDLSKEMLLCWIYIDLKPGCTFFELTIHP